MKIKDAIIVGIGTLVILVGLLLFIFPIVGFTTIPYVFAEIIAVAATGIVAGGVVMIALEGVEIPADGKGAFCPDCGKQNKPSPIPRGFSPKNGAKVFETLWACPDAQAPIDVRCHSYKKSRHLVFPSTSISSNAALKALYGSYYGSYALKGSIGLSDPHLSHTEVSLNCPSCRQQLVNSDVLSQEEADNL